MMKKRFTFMRLPSILLLALWLSGCHLFQVTPRPAPPLTDSPQEIQRMQSQGLTKMGQVTVMVRGSPMNAETAIKEKAAAAGADYYLILFNDETRVPGQRYAQAILYRQ